MNPTVLDAFQKWHNTDAGEYKLFGLTATAEEATELAKLESDINTYHDEMVTKFILGIEPISNFEKFQEQLKVMGAERILQMKQAQYDRFLKR
jgi:putative aldouronate transport system substrate-binding protein